MGNKIPPSRHRARCINGRYCLYECHCIYDKERKRNRKITGKYLGSITEEGGFRPSKKRQLEQEMEQLKNGEKATVAEPKIGQVKEYGLSWLISNKMGTITERLKRIFQTITTYHIPCLLQVALSVSHERRAVRLLRQLSFYRTRHCGLAASQLSGFLFDLGTGEEIVKYMDYFCSGSSNIIFDGTDMLSASRLMGLPQLTKTKTGPLRRQST